MKVHLHPADEAGCGWYRVRYPAMAAEREGIEVEVSTDIPQLAEDGPDGLRLIGPAATDADVVVLQRPAKTSIVNVIEPYQRMGKTVIVDVDDDFSCLHPQHPAHDHFNPSLNSEVNWRNIARACSLADLVTVTTPALAERYGAHGRVAVIPNCVPAALLEMPRWNDGRTMGWTGAAHMHPGDLEVTRGGVAEAVKRLFWRFRVVGKHELVGDRLGLGDLADGTGWLDMEQWHSALGILDVGIVPLCDSAFNRAKSYLKGVELAARGVPFVASPLPEYEWLAEQGVGLLAQDRGRNWRGQLLKLMQDESLREEQVAAGRQFVADHATFEGEGWRWCEAWETAHRNAGRRAVALA